MLEGHLRDYLGFTQINQSYNSSQLTKDSELGAGALGAGCSLLGLVHLAGLLRDGLSVNHRLSVGPPTPFECKQAFNGNII